MKKSASLAFTQTTYKKKQNPELRERVPQATVFTLVTGKIDFPFLTSSKQVHSNFSLKIDLLLSP